MSLALILAAAFAAFAFLALFAWPLAWAFPGQRLKRLAQPDMQFVTGCTVSLCAVTAVSPIMASALISGGETVHTVASLVFAIDFSL